MIRNTLNQIRSATFCVELPNKASNGLPTPAGTGFFISPDGWFVTAAHVTSEDGASDGPQRSDIGEAWLMKEATASSPGAMCQFAETRHVLPKYDFALLKVDFNKNANKDWLKGQAGFPFIRVAKERLTMSEPVYSFGYPLSGGQINSSGSILIGTTELREPLNIRSD